MVIAVGDTIPDVNLTQATAKGPVPISTTDLFSGRKVVLFAVPGAFTPTCHLKHLPGFIENADAIMAKGVDAIMCLSVNDGFVMQSWAEATNAGDKVSFIADGNGEFTKAVDLALDASAFGMGLRSQRYAMLIDDGRLTALNIEPTAGEAKVSGAEGILEEL